MMTNLLLPDIWAIVVFDIDGVVRDVSGSYRRALADTVEHFTSGSYRPSPTDIDVLKAEGRWNNDWQASQELIYRYFEAQGQARTQIDLDYETLVTFFQTRYRGADPFHWTGYITQEPLLMGLSYLETLTQSGIAWGFFSGATRGSANYVLEKRLGLQNPLLIAMEDAPGKPDPSGLLVAVQALESQHRIENPLPVFYIGDTVADLQTVQNARQHQSFRQWVGVGVLPPHVQEDSEHSTAYGSMLQKAGAEIVLENVEQLRPDLSRKLIHTHR
jgi:HAD superfamily phosphatase